MPKVGEKEFPYTEEGIKDAAKESMSSGIPINDASGRAQQMYPGGGKTGYNLPKYHEGGYPGGKSKEILAKEKAKKEKETKERASKRKESLEAETVRKVTKRIERGERQEKRAGEKEVRKEERRKRREIRAGKKQGRQTKRALKRGFKKLQREKFNKEQAEKLEASKGERTKRHKRQYQLGGKIKGQPGIRPPLPGTAAHGGMGPGDLDADFPYGLWEKGGKVGKQAAAAPKGKLKTPPKYNPKDEKLPLKHRMYIEKYGIKDYNKRVNKAAAAGKKKLDLKI